MYEGAQALGEIRSGQLSHRLITGLSLDETIARVALASGGGGSGGTGSGNADPARSRHFLTDALNSVVAQMHASTSGGLANSYAYSPYGQSTTVGPDDTANPIQYTSRENDQTGLLFYRARYYDPVMKRFISSDPIGLAGGMNMFAYVEGDPVSYTDPLGLWAAGVELYGGFGGGILFGRDPNTGQGFLSLRGGIGLGGGFSFDPYAGRPGGGQACPGTGGVTVGAYGNLGVNAGIAGFGTGAGVELSGGYDSGRGKTYADGAFPFYLGYDPGARSGLGFGGAVGGEITLYDRGGQAR